MMSNTTIDKQGAKSFCLKATGPENCMAAHMLSC